MTAWISLQAPAPDTEARRAAVARHADLAVPTGALGRLAELGVWLAAAQGRCPPRPPAQPRIVVVVADHGIAAAGVSADPADATHAQMAAIRDHSAPVTVLAPVSETSVRVVDAGGAAPSDDRFHIRESSGRIDREDALTAEEAERGVEAGRALADEEIDSGADLLIPASIGVGATTPASTIVAALTGTEPVAVIGRGSGIDDAGWMRKAAAVRDALRRAKPVAHDPLDAAPGGGRRRPGGAHRLLPAGRGAAHAGAARRARRRRRGGARRRAGPRRARVVAGRAALPRARDGDRARPASSSRRWSTSACGSATARARRPSSPLVQMAARLLGETVVVS